MITAELQGRRLVLTVRDDDGTAAFEPYVVEPLTAKAGRELSGRYIFAIEGLPPMDPEGPTVNDDFIAAFGAKNYERADGELHQSEMELCAQAAYFWQSVGGMDAVRELLGVDPDGQQGGPVSRGKALGSFKLRVVPLLQQISHHLESARQTQTAATPGTSTRKGGGKRGSARSSKPSNAADSVMLESTPTPAEPDSPELND